MSFNTRKDLSFSIDIQVAYLADDRYFHISKMSNFTHYATDLRKFPTETTDLRFPQKFFTKLLKIISLLYSHTIHRNCKVSVLRTCCS